jgi:hypothetical protein
MTEKNSLVEEAIIQMKNLEEVIAENAKGILASTMKQEIKEMVKESLNEADEDEEEVEDEMDVEMDVEMDDEDFGDEEFDMSMDTEMDDEDEETLDLTGMDSESVVKIFAALEDGDEIEVVHDEPGKVHFKDNRTNKEYIIMTESEMEKELEDAIESTFMEEYDDQEEFDFDVEMDDEEEMDFEMDDEDMDELDLEFMSMDEEEMVGLGMEEPMESADYMESMYEESDEEEVDETIYELEIEEEGEDDYVMETKKEFKAKGEGMGKQSFTYGKLVNHPTKKMKKADEAPFAGKGPKYEFDKNSPSLKGEFKEGKHSMMKSHSKMEKKEGMMKKGETKEASRTLGSGSNFRKGGLPKPRAHSGFNANIEESVNNKELMLLREKNEEYRKALNVFRTKLNEVAVFNSNLAYATRLFTEHSTSKQEKINILKRFDSVESLKESKNLYKTIKDELSTSKTQQVNESIERTIQKSPSSGSASNLIESKTYENPQFLRMKDLMSKIK